LQEEKALNLNLKVLMRLKKEESPLDWLRQKSIFFTEANVKRHQNHIPLDLDVPRLVRLTLKCYIHASKHSQVTGPGPFPKPFFIQNWSKIIISHSLLYLRHGKSTLTRMGQVCEERLAQSSDALWNTPMLAKFPQVDTITCTLDPLRLLFSAPVFLTLV
jgi:hypothetical protein